MTDSARPGDVYGETLDSLRADDLIAPVEQLRRFTFELLNWLPENVNDEQAENGFPLLRERLEECLAIAQPLLDFADQRGVEEVCWMLQTLASDQGDSSRLLYEPMSSLALHDLSWTLFADCLARDRLEPLSRLAGIVVPDPHDHTMKPIFQVSSTRHTNAYERSADRTYTGWRGWIMASEFVSALPHFGNGPRLTALLAEAELIAALCFASEHGERSFCASLGDGGGERRLRAHCRKTQGVSAFGRLLGVSDMDLVERMNELYAQLVGPDHFGPWTTLISV